MPYQLNVDFSTADLNIINQAQEQVVIVKQVNGSSSASSVAWVAFNPLPANSVTWSDSYTLYATRTQLQSNATIQMLAQATAMETESLPFTSTATFGPADPTVVLPSDTYGVENQYTVTPYMTFGLAQAANITGSGVPASPINAVMVPENQSATFEPLDVIQVFLMANVNNGMVLSSVQSKAITVTFGAGVNEHTITYNAAIGGFQLTS